MAKLCFSAISFFVLFYVSTISVFAKNTSADENKKPVAGFGIEFKFFGADVSANDYLKEINNVPIELRQVPSHPNDTWIYGSTQVVRTIPYDSIKLGAASGLLFSLSPELTIWRFRVRSGPNLYWSGLGKGPSKSNEGNTREINQYGEPLRGYGTSLVYYSIYSQNSWKPGVTNEADLDIGKDFLLIAGYSWNNYKLVSESGYDRWDALEKYQRHEVAVSRRIKKYLGFGWQPNVDDNGWRPIMISLMVGKSRTLTRLTEAGKGMTFQYGNPWFLEFNFSVHGFFWKK